jgi:hypothetical protein
MIVPNYQKTIILQECVMKKHTLQWHVVHVNLRRKKYKHALLKNVGSFVLSLKLPFLSLCKTHTLFFYVEGQ